jgi:hypothetical protein
MQGTGGHRPHVGVVDVILLDFLQNLAVYSERLVGLGVRRVSQDMAYSCVA